MTTRETLRALAAKATPGPWYSTGASVVDERGRRQERDGMVFHVYGNRAGNCPYLAALSPARILALLDVVEAGQEVADAGALLATHYPERVGRLRKALAALDAVLPRKDAPEDA